VHSTLLELDEVQRRGPCACLFVLFLEQPRDEEIVVDLRAHTRQLSQPFRSPLDVDLV
jgi:hypothetical protein